MSHIPERKEKDCLNCGTIVQGKYCHVCGQENVVPRETFWAMLTHFVYDITHFDGKFFSTLGILLRKPGFLSKEYMKGKRASYLNPVRMYIFTSAFFFLVFFSLKGTNDYIKLTDDFPLTQAGRDSVLRKIEGNEYRGADSLMLMRAKNMLKDTSLPVKPSDLLGLNRDFVVMATINRIYHSRAEYDSVQEALPAKERDGWLERLWNKRALAVNEKYKYDPAMSWQKFADILLHKLPYLLFVSLPFFALLLRWLYYRRKEFYYADHGIFTIHHYIVSFFLLLFVFLWNKLEELSGWGIWNWMIAATVIAIPVYLYKGMRRFYSQSRAKTILKFILLNISALIVMAFLFVIFTLLSVFTL